MKSAQINSNKSVIFVCWRTRHFFPINHYMINEMNGNRQIDRQPDRQANIPMGVSLQKLSRTKNSIN